MANPPITIGPFENVPAAGSPIRSDWAQQISRFVNDRFPLSTLMKTGTAVYPTNAAGDALIGFTAPFPTALISVLVTDATQGLDVAFIPKFMQAASTLNTAVVRIYLHDGTKVLSNGSITLSWLAFGR